jgi:ABC-2 type transport system ATP-binding protein
MHSVTVIRTRGLSMRFGAQLALDDLDLDIPAGVTGLVGANGAGKTTLMSIVLGLRPPTSGTVEALGLDPIRHGSELRAHVGYAPERNVLPDDTRAVDFVRHLAEVRGLPRNEARNRASDALWLVGLGEERFRALGTMSTGQRSSPSTCCCRRICSRRWSGSATTSWPSTPGSSWSRARWRT